MGHRARTCGRAVNASAGQAAKPGDADLDFDVDGITVTAVIRDDGGVLFRLAGGHGYYTDAAGQMRYRHPGDPTAHLRGVDILIRFPGLTPDAFAAYVARLEMWRDLGTLLRMCAAPGRTSTLGENGTDRVVLIPRRRQA